MAEMTAQDIMTKNVVTISKDSSIEELSELLLKNKISGVPVTDENGRLEGIVTEADIIVRDTDLHFPRYFKLLDAIIYLESFRKFRENLKKHLATRVEDIMNEKVITIKTDTPLSEAAEIMLDKKINRLPVLEEDGSIAGIVTRADIVKSMTLKKQ
ncbi:MAG: CBS domain-containing protein [Actinobacteria bacterium]|nr:CBS domain-containing protein [Actinomycetota bacterium]